MTVEGLPLKAAVDGYTPPHPGMVPRYRVVVGGDPERPSQGVILLRMSGEHISELTLPLRPLAALRAFASAMAELGAQPAVDAGNEAR